MAELASNNFVDSFQPELVILSHGETSDSTASDFTPDVAFLQLREDMCRRIHVSCHDWLFQKGKQQRYDGKPLCRKSHLHGMHNSVCVQSHIYMACITAFGQSVGQASKCRYQDARMPFATFVNDVYPQQARSGQLHRGNPSEPLLGNSQVKLWGGLEDFRTVRQDAQTLP